MSINSDSAKEYQKAFLTLPEKEQEVLKAMHQEEANEVNATLAQSETAKEINGILDATSEYLHTVPPTHPAVVFLMEYQEEHKNDEGEMKKIRNIIIHEDHIEVAGYKIKSANEYVSPNSEKGIYEYKGNTYFKFKAAMEYAKGRCPSKQQWANILEAMPGLRQYTRGINAQKILGIPSIEMRTTDEIWVQPSTAYLWTSSGGFLFSDATYFSPNTQMKSNNEDEKDNRMHQIDKNCGLPLRLFY